MLYTGSSSWGRGKGIGGEVRTKRTGASEVAVRCPPGRTGGTTELAQLPVHPWAELGVVWGDGHRKSIYSPGRGWGAEGSGNAGCSPAQQHGDPCFPAPLMLGLENAPAAPQFSDIWTGPLSDAWMQDAGLPRSGFPTSGWRVMGHHSLRGIVSRQVIPILGLLGTPSPPLPSGCWSVSPGNPKCQSLKVPGLGSPQF